MNENAGGQTCRQKQTRALSPHCKNANANCKFQLERNSLLCFALSKTPVSSSLPLALTLLLGAQCARGALCLCILCCNCVSRYKFQWALLCYALRSVVEGREGRGVTGGAHTKAEEEDARAYSACACMCVCVCCVGYFIFYNFLLLFCILFNLLTHNNSHYFLFLFYTRFGFANISTNEKQEHTNKKR